MVARPELPPAAPHCAARTRSSSATTRRASICAGLPADADIFVRTYFENLDSERARSEAVDGPLPHAALKRRRDVRFLWSGDTAGQGWGINLPFGGMKIYEAMRQDAAGFLHPLG